MKKSLFIIFLIMSYTAFGQTLPYKDAIKIIASNIQSKITGNDIVAIVNFQAATSQFSNKVMNDLTNELIMERVRIIDRQNLDKIHVEQQYQISGYVDDKYAVSIGHELGAAAIILGNGENMADYYRFNFRMLSVETTEILMQFSINVKYDSSMRRMLNANTFNSSSIGSTHFMIGARIGAGFEMNAADEDMVGTGYSPKEKSNIAFNAALIGAFRFNDIWSVQPEINIMINNGMEITRHGNAVKIDYTTMDIPLFLRWNFIHIPIVAGIMAGPYISMPLGKLNLSIDDGGSALDTGGYTFGITGGFTIGVKAGPGHLTADVRYLNDFKSLYVFEDFGEGLQEANICIRRSFNITVGYEISL